MPRVSIVIPAFNQASYLPQAIDSALAQTHAPVEVIVVNDGSTDGTAGVIASSAGRPGLRAIVQNNRGLPAARNRGLAESTGEFVAFLDADDWVSPHHVERLLAPLVENPALGFAYGDVQLVDAAGQPAGDYSVGAARRELTGDLLPSLVQGGYFPPHCVLARRSVLDALGGFDPDLGGHADYEMWLRIAAAGYPSAYVDERLAFYRQHAGSMSRDASHMRASCRDALVRVTRRFPDRVAHAVSGLQAQLRDLHEANTWLRDQWQPILRAADAARAMPSASTPAEVRWSLLDSLDAARRVQGAPEHVACWEAAIGGRRDRCLFLHPPAALELTIPDGRPGRLMTAVALHPAMWQESRAGACAFTLTVNDTVGAQAILDPVRREGDRRWVDLSLDLPESASGTRSLTIATQAIGTDRYVHALFRDVVLLAC